MPAIKELMIEGRSLYEWDKLWTLKPNWLDAEDIDLRLKVGLFRFLLDGVVVFLGRATELGNGGLAKRVKDFIRSSDSGRRHCGGEQVHQHRASLTLEILETGTDHDARRIAVALRDPMITRHKPSWNAPEEAVTKLKKARRS